MDEKTKTRQGGERSPRPADTASAGLRDDGFARLVKASYTEPAVPADLERRIMLDVARRSIELSRCKAKAGLVASLSGLAMLLAGCVAILVSWLPGRLPLLKVVEMPKPKGWLADMIASSAFMEQWGGWLVLALLAAGAAGFIYYLNSLFSSSYAGEK